MRGAPKGTAYYASKFALRGMTECWRAELRKHNVRVFLVNPSEVVTNFSPTAGLPQKENATKLRGEDIAYVVKTMLEMDDRGFVPESPFLPRIRRTDRNSGNAISRLALCGTPTWERSVLARGFCDVQKQNNRRQEARATKKRLARYLMLFSLPSFT